MMDNLVFKSIRELSPLIRQRQVSPVALTELFLARLETLGPQYNAVVTVTRERAMAQAKRAEREIAAGQYRGPLHGIPYGAKDLLATSGGIPTTWGAEPFRNQTFAYDAAVIQKLEEAGAILAAKLAMVELAGGMGYRQPNASFTGPGINPWNRQRWTGGSSSGSAAAVAAGLVPFAIGSETWGSILLPATYCGLAGLRPTHGRVSRYGAMVLSWTLDKLGPLCLTADDCGLVLAAIAGPDPRDAATIDAPFRYDSSVGGRHQLRLALFKNVIQDIQDDAIRSNFERALETLRQVATIEEIELPPLPYEVMTRIILQVESASAFEDFIENGRAAQLTAPEDRFGPYARTAILAQDYLKALRVRGKMARAVDAALAPYDAVVGLTHAGAATPVDQSFQASFQGTFKDLMGAIGNGAGLPAVSVPNGFTADGLPTGIQFMGRAFDENKVLQIAHVYQSLTDWHLHHPTDAIPDGSGG